MKSGGTRDRNQFADISKMVGGRKWTKIKILIGITIQRITII